MKYYFYTFIAFTVFGIGILTYYTQNEPRELGAEKVDSFSFEEKDISAKYTDENVGENLIIKSDQSVYGGWDKITSYFSITNNSGKDQDVKIQFRFQGAESIVVSELQKKVPYQVMETVYEEVESTCLDQDNKEISCVEQKETGTALVTKYADRWHVLGKEPVTKTISEKEVPDFNRNNQTSFFIPANETRFFKADIDIENKRNQQTEFYIEAFGDNAYGVLDPFYDSNYTYCRKMTMAAGGDVGGVATTSTFGFALVATSTISTLAGTTSAGNIQRLDNNEETPIDVVFTNGTDCNADGGTLIDFYFEKYASTTGAFTAWLEAGDISSTSAKTVLMYYGNANATNQSNEAGVFGAIGELGVWDLGVPGFATTSMPDFLDSTANNSDGTSAHMTDTTLINGYLGGGLNYDAGNDIITTSGDTFDNLKATGGLTILAWINADTIGENSIGRIVDKSNATTPTNGWLIAVTISTVNRTEFLHSGTTILRCMGPTLTLDVPHFVGYTWTGGDTASTLKYVQDAGTGDCLLPQDGNTLTSDAAEFLKIGNDKSLARTFDGLIDDVRIYKWPLDPMDLLTIYNNTANSAGFWTFGAEETETVAVSGPRATVILNGATMIINNATMIAP